MNAILLQQISDRFRASIPMMLTLVLALLSVVPIGVSGFAAVTPALSVIAFFFWSIYKPSSMPPWAVFLVGVFQDLMSGTPLGLTSLVLLGVHLVAASQRKAFVAKPFYVGWIGFIPVSAVATVAGWVLACLYFTTLLDPRHFVVSYLLTVAIYPAAAWFFGQFQALVVTRE